MNDQPLPPPYRRACWCGDYRQFPWSHEYNVCRVCGTLVSTFATSEDPAAVSRDTDELYSKRYWLERQADKYGLPDIVARARLDLPERCAYWLREILKYKLPSPGAKSLELGCAHGGLVALMKWAGFEAAGLEMSPWVVEFAKTTFGVEVFTGPLETQERWPSASLDVIILNDVIEHLPDPLATLRRTASLLKPDGLIFIQTPEYKEHLDHAALMAAGEDHTRPMKGKNEEHLFLYSRRATRELWARLGLQVLDYLPALFPYDMFYVVGRSVSPKPTAEAVAEVLQMTPEARMVQALLTLEHEARGRMAEIQRLQAR